MLLNLLRWCLPKTQNRNTETYFSKRIGIKCRLIQTYTEQNNDHTNNVYNLILELP